MTYVYRVFVRLSIYVGRVRGYPSLNRVCFLFCYQNHGTVEE